MYMLQDAGYEMLSVTYFVSFIIFGSFFMLNLTLAVIWENFSDASEAEAEEQKKTDGLVRPSRPTVRHLTMEAYHSSRFRRAMSNFVHHWIFTILQALLILMNTIVLSLDKYPIDDKLESMLELMNFILILAFSLESLVKITALGWHCWTQDRFNLFDAILVTVSLLEIGLSPPRFLFSTKTLSKATATSFSGLRSVRLLSLFKLARLTHVVGAVLVLFYLIFSVSNCRLWPSLHKLLLTMLSTLQEVGHFGVLFMLFIYIYALIGIQIFSNKFRFDELGYPVDRYQTATYIPRANFDTMIWSMVTVFQVRANKLHDLFRLVIISRLIALCQILTGENWNNVFYDGWRSTGWTSVLYFISLVVFGDFIMLNLFLAILLGNFEASSDEAKNAERELLRQKSRVTPMHSVRSERESIERTATESKQSTKSRRLSRMPSLRSRRTSVTQVDQSPFSLPMPPIERTTIRSLFIFTRENLMRKLATEMIAHPNFDAFSFAMTVISSIGVALDSPLNEPDGILVNLLAWEDLTITVFFVVEVMVKIIALGFFMDKNSYLRSSWNVMDFVITGIAGFSSINRGSQFKLLKTLRIFRALRPLRMINRNPGLKLVVNSLIASIPGIVNVIVVCVLVFTIFSIVAVNNFKGKFASCSGDVFDGLTSSQQYLVMYPRIWDDLTSDERFWFNSTSALMYGNASAAGFITSRVVCELLSAKWESTISQSFNNVALGYQALFQMTTGEGWVDIMLAGVDATEIDMQPVPNHREIWTLFFILFMLIGTFFIMQLFVGVVIGNFNQMKEKLDGTYLLSSTQREWLVINDSMMNLHPMRKRRIPQSKIRRTCFRIANNPDFELVMMGCIVLNTILMAQHYFGEENLYRKAIEYANYTFACIFALEASIKIIGLGGYYWKDSWNMFDFVLFLGSIGGLLYTYFGGTSVGTAATSVRSFRVGRLFRLVQSAPTLRQLFNTLLATLPSLVNIGGVLFLIQFIYAAMGVQLFAKVKFGQQVTADANFQTLPKAMLTLVRSHARVRMLMSLLLMCATLDTMRHWRNLE